MKYITIKNGERLPEFENDTKKEILKLIKGCSNCNPNGSCRLLPESPKCPQSHTNHVCCSYFRQNVLPSKPELEAECLDLGEIVKCERCGKKFRSLSNSQKYCNLCSGIVKSEKNRERQQKYRERTKK